MQLNLFSGLEDKTVLDVVFLLWELTYLSMIRSKVDLIPMQVDIRLTNQIKKAGEFLKIKLLDSIIVTSSTYFSFADEGMI